MAETQRGSGRLSRLATGLSRRLRVTEHTQLVTSCCGSALILLDLGLSLRKFVMVGWRKHSPKSPERR
jgi:hypothetical protein